MSVQGSEPSEPPEGTQVARTSSGSDTGAFGATLDDVIEGKMRGATVPSLSAAVVRGQTLAWSKGYGWADREADIRANADTVYLLASISKTFIAAAVMKLWEEGSLDLDADINTYIPFPVRNPDHPSAGITMRMLLTHTSSIKDRSSYWGPIEGQEPTGYTRGDSPIPLSQAMTGYLQEGGEYYRSDGNFYRAEPGTEYQYSNLGSDAAAYIVEVLSGTLYREFVKDNLLTPLGMLQSGYHLSDISTANLAMPYSLTQPPSGHFIPFFQYGSADYPCGLMRSSANSLSIWLRTFMNGGSFEGTRILKSATVEEILRPQLPGNEWDQGLMWFRETRGGERLIGHTGSDYGVNTAMFFSPDRDIGFIALTNRNVGDEDHFDQAAYDEWLDIGNRLVGFA